MRMQTIMAISATALLVAGCQKASILSKPPQNGPDQKVQLKWQQNQWKVSLNGGPDQNPKTATITLPNGQGPTKFIVDITGSTVTFKDPGGLTVWEGAKTNPPGSTQIIGQTVLKNGKLEFWDLNYGSKVKIYYSLNLSDNTSVDPIIDNGGGTWSQ